MAHEREREEADRHAEDRSLEARRARQHRAETRRETPGRTGPASRGVLVQVCMRCGKEYTFDDGPPEELTCEKCGNGVFRSFFAPLRDDEAESEFRETTERDLATDDAEGDATRGDVLDLNNP